MDWTKRKVLVTGAGGFIGSHLCETLLDKGADVTAMIRYTSRSDWGNLEFLSEAKKNELKVVAGNIEDSYFVARQIEGKNIVFHLAALIAIPYSYIAPLSYVRSNAEGTLNIMEAAQNSSVQRVIHTSTSETYGTAIYTPIDERHPLQGQSPYSASKIAADKIAESYHLSFDLPLSIIRPFNTYGPRQSARAIIPTIITQALTQDEIRLGALDPVRDMTYVKDMVDGFIKIAESEEATGEAINVGFGEGLSIKEIAGTILSIIGCEKPIIQDKRRLRPDKSEVYVLICDNTKVKNMTHWKAKYSLKEGIAETIDFISKNLEIYKSDTYVI